MLKQKQASWFQYPLVATDYVEATVFQNSGAALNIDAAEMSVFRIPGT